MTNSDQGEEKAPLILIVDDARVNRELLRLHLTKHGHQFLMAENGRQATEILAGRPEVDLILLDLMMPEMDGFDFLRWRGGNPAAQAIPVIVNSSLDDFDSIAQALTMDTYDYFTKPLSASDLETVLPLKIRNAVAARRLMSATSRQNELMRRELEMAARYQQFLLPHGVDLPGVELSYLFQPCTGVGGDYFDFLRLGGSQVGFVLADVSGHGVAAAMTASIVKALLPGYLERFLSPARALGSLNDDLLRLTPDDVFVTAFAALYDNQERRLTWCLAGHPSPLYLGGDGQLRRLSQESVFLGVFGSENPVLGFTNQSIAVEPGDRLIFYTDGLTEAPSPQGELFGLRRLEALLADHAQAGLAQVRTKLWDALKSHVQGEFPDDVAFILARF